MTQPQAAVAIVHSHCPAESILLMRRSEREEDPWSGHWSFPGGRCDPEDADLIHTALRELEEECGIRLTREQMEAALPVTLARRKAGPFLLVAPFQFGVDCELATVLDQREVADVLWVPLDELRNPARHALRPVPGRPPEILYPAVELNGTPLWGFTYRLITDWLGLVGTPQPPEPPGFQEASRVLQFLLSRGLTLERGWESQGKPEARVALVQGAIPVASVLAHFSRPAGQIPAISCLEVHPDSVRVLGPGFEEFVVRTTGQPRT